MNKRGWKKQRQRMKEKKKYRQYEQHQGEFKKKNERK